MLDFVTQCARRLGRRCLPLLLALPIASLLHERSMAAVFGAGATPESGFDDRVVLGSAEWNSLRFGDWTRAGGTIHCDGRQRGSAVILDAASLGMAAEGSGRLVLATAAHVLFDLDSGRRFSACSFHYLGLSQLPGYRADIELTSSLIGDFDPLEPRDGVGFGEEDWAFLKVSGDLPAATGQATLGLLDWSSLSSEQQAKYRLSLVAWSARHNRMSLTPDCRVTLSQSDDLGGGAWPGQLLDDCDSGPGASGGGLVVSRDGAAWLIGLRTGSHYDGVRYPLQEYPDGPPEGSPWDRKGNTNFARAIDQGMLKRVREFLAQLDHVQHSD